MSPAKLTIKITRPNSRTLVPCSGMRLSVAGHEYLWIGYSVSRGWMSAVDVVGVADDTGSVARLFPSEREAERVAERILSRIDFRHGTVPETAHA